jgi:hypothetical protein
MWTKIWDLGPEESKELAEEKRCRKGQAAIEETAKDEKFARLRIGVYLVARDAPSLPVRRRDDSPFRVRDEILFLQ